tara:strand:+ start:5762 stop:6034 length:273 start_codon:yes stop_codon:yes gene_type:complete
MPVLDPVIPDSANQTISRDMISGETGFATVVSYSLFSDVSSDKSRVIYFSQATQDNRLKGHFANRVSVQFQKKSLKSSVRLGAAMPFSTQ